MNSVGEDSVKMTVDEPMEHEMIAVVYPLIFTIKIERFWCRSLEH
jgi:hypothetical protein